MRALIIEDDLRFARFLQRIFVETGYVADVCSDGPQALAQVRRVAYQLVVLELQLRAGGGIEVCQSLRAEGVTAPILMIASATAPHSLVLARRADADDLLEPPFRVGAFKLRVSALTSQACRRTDLRVGALAVDGLSGEVLLDEQPLRLTWRERALLLHLMHHAERNVTRAELLAQAWGGRLPRRSNLVDVAICRLRAKLGPCSWMLQTVPESGYCLTNHGTQGERAGRKR